MKPHFTYLFALLALCFSICSCRKKIKQLDDDVYSRHLQQHVKLTIFSTPIPDDKSQLNLLLLNDGQDAGQVKVTEALDSLYKAKAIQPLVVVAIHAAEREAEYGVAGFPDYKKRGNKADNYAAFVDDELYPYIKKHSGVRKFKSIAIAGASLGGLSAFDIAWNHADKIDMVGVFSGSFWWRDKDTSVADYSDEKNRIMLTYIKSSRKKPHLQYWFYAGAKEEDNDRDKDGIIDVIDDTKDLIEIIKTKKVASSSEIVYTEAQDGIHNYSSWSREFPKFLTWAFGR